MVLLTDTGGVLVLGDFFQAAELRFTGFKVQRQLYYGHSCDTRDLMN